MFLNQVLVVTERIKLRSRVSDSVTVLYVCVEDGLCVMLKLKLHLQAAGSRDLISFTFINAIFIIDSIMI